MVSRGSRAFVGRFHFLRFQSGKRRSIFSLSLSLLFLVFLRSRNSMIVSHNRYQRIYIPTGLKAARYDND